MAITLKPCILTPRKAYIGNNTCPGEKSYIRTKLSIDKDTGEKKAEPGEVVPLDDIIQTYAAQTDIVSIIQRLQSGDTSVINVRSDGIEGDITQLPRSVNDIVNIEKLNNEAKSGFDNLPADIKALFGNDPAQFYQAVITNKVDSILKSYKPVEDKKEEEAE